MPIWELNDLMTNGLIMNLSFAELSFQIDARNYTSDWLNFTWWAPIWEPANS